MLCPHCYSGQLVKNWVRVLYSQKRLAAAYARRAVRKMRGTLGRMWHGNVRHRRLFCSRTPDVPETSMHWFSPITSTGECDLHNLHPVIAYVIGRVSQEAQREKAVSARCATLLGDRSQFFHDTDWPPPLPPASRMPAAMRMSGSTKAHASAMPILSAGLDLGEKLPDPVDVFVRLLCMWTDLGPARVRNQTMYLLGHPAGMDVVVARHQ